MTWTYDPNARSARIFNRASRVRKIILSGHEPDRAPRLFDAYDVLMRAAVREQRSEHEAALSVRTGVENVPWPRWELRARRAAAQARRGEPDLLRLHGVCVWCGHRDDEPGHPHTDTCVVPALSTRRAS